MKEKLLRAIDFISTIVYGCFAVLFIGVLITSIRKDVIDICVRMGVTWKVDVNYFGLFAGFGAYIIYFFLYLIIPKIKHNLTWFMKFTHELTHTLVALLFFAKIHKFIVMERECDVYYESKVGYVPITLSPYCIPIYTFMLFPFRFAGDNEFMIVFDFLIAFTYAFHVHSFIKYTRYTQSDIQGCGPVLSTTFITFMHLCVLSLIAATPKGGVIKAISRVFYEYPLDILRNLMAWFHDIIQYF